MGFLVSVRRPSLVRVRTVRETSVTLDRSYRGPTVTDRYKTIRKIGEGGQGKTELVRRISDQKTLIRKEQRHFRMHGNRPLEHFLFESVLVPHPSIVYYDHGNYTEPSGRNRAGSLVLYFEHCGGGDLHDYLHEYTRYGDRIPESFIWEVFCQIADALVFLHYGYNTRAASPGTPPRGWQRVIHRDIKPANIFFRRRPTRDNPVPDVVLGDFGLATLKTESHEKCGTDTWVPPEWPEWTAKGDLYGLGSTIHALAHGHAPGSTRNGRPSPLSKYYGRNLNEEMMDCLRSDPRKRVSSFELYPQIKQDRWRFNAERDPNF